MTQSDGTAAPELNLVLEFGFETDGGEVTVGERGILGSGVS